MRGESKGLFQNVMNWIIVIMIGLIILLLATAKCNAQHPSESDHDRIIRLEERVNGLEKEHKEEVKEKESYYNYDYGLGQKHKKQLESQGNKDIVQYIILGFLGLVNAILSGKFVIDVKRRKNGNNT